MDPGEYQPETRGPRASPPPRDSQDCPDVSTQWPQGSVPELVAVKPVLG